MTKAPAIFLLLCFLSYHFGYYAAYFSRKGKVERDWFERIYSQKPSGLKEMQLKIPLQVAYMPDQEDFQESNASFEKDGMHYRIIKQRYKKDTLVIVYVPDQEKNQLNNMVVQWAKSLAASNPEGGKGLSTVKVPYPDYNQTEIGVLDFPFFSIGRCRAPMSFPSLVPMTMPDLSSPPPELAG